MAPSPSGPFACTRAGRVAWPAIMAVSIDRDLNDVLVFLQVVASGTFTAAGRALRVPTSTVSRRVARLEEQLGVRLLQRTTRKLSLTEAGRLYYERGSAFFSELEQTENVLADAQASPRGRVRATAPLEHSISMRVITPFIERYPDVRVDLELTNRSVNIIEEGYDASICAGPIPSLSVVAHKLMDSPFRIVASPKYLARRGAPETPEALSEHDCVVFGPASSASTWTVPTDDGLLHVPVHGRLAVNHMAAVRDATVAGLGIALLPELVCCAALACGELEVVLPGIAPPPVPVWVTHPAGRFLPPAVKAFVQHVRENFADLATVSGPTPGRTRRKKAKATRKSKATKKTR